VKHTHIKRVRARPTRRRDARRTGTNTYLIDAGDGRAIVIDPAPRAEHIDAICAEADIDGWTIGANRGDARPPRSRARRAPPFRANEGSCLRASRGRASHTIVSSPTASGSSSATSPSRRSTRRGTRAITSSSGSATRRALFTGDVPSRQRDRRHRTSRRPTCADINRKRRSTGCARIPRSAPDRRRGTRRERRRSARKTRPK